MTLANTVNLTPTSGSPTPTPTPPTGYQAVVFATDAGSPTANFSATDPAMVGDTGSGGLAGNVPAPAAGTAAAGKFLKADGSWSATSMVIGFVINTGTAGTNVGPMLASPRAGTFSKCVIVTRASDPSTDLTFKIKQNGVDVFSADPTVAHGTASGTVTTSVALTSVPLAVAAGDVFSMDISSGTASWLFSAQLET